MFTRTLSRAAIAALAVMSMFAASGASAATVTIDTDDFASASWSDLGFGSASATIGDFDFYVDNIISTDTGIFAGVPDATYAEDTYTVIDVRRADGQTFSVTGIDFLLQADMGAGVTVKDADGTRYDWRGGNGQATYTSINDLGNIQYLALYSAGGVAYAELNSITVGAAVPVPAAIWLFGSALAGLGWMRRKQTV